MPDLARPPVRVVIADDEPLARERLHQLLAHRPGYVVVADCEDGPQAVRTIADAKPDLVFLDIRMPELDGMQVAESLASAPAAPALVFVTAHSEYAQQAFEVSALDYLLKPVQTTRFERTLDKVEARWREGGAGAVDDRLLHFLERLGAGRYPERFVVRSHAGLYFVQARAIDWVSAEGNYVGVHAEGRTHLIRDTIGSFEGKLDPARFLRVHRSAIVNLDFVARLEPYVHGEYYVVLKDGTRLTSSRAHSARLRALVG